MIGLLALEWGRVDLPWVSPILLENRQNGKEGHGSNWEQEKVRHSNRFSMPPPRTMDRDSAGFASTSCLYVNKYVSFQISQDGDLGSCGSWLKASSFSRNQKA